MKVIHRRKQAGLTMIEVLITLLIVSFGLLGVGALQLMSLQVNQGANQRTQAALLATSVLDVIRGNRPNAIRYARAFGDSAPAANSALVWESDMAGIVNQLQAVLPGGELEVLVVPAPTTNNKPFFDVSVTVRWSESDRLLDRNEATPAAQTVYNLRTDV
jgi:type IV pilus assembly protein PilV